MKPMERSYWLTRLARVSDMDATVNESDFQRAQAAHRRRRWRAELRAGCLDHACAEWMETVDRHGLPIETARRLAASAGTPLLRAMRDEERRLHASQRRARLVRSSCEACDRAMAGLALLLALLSAGLVLMADRSFAGGAAAGPGPWLMAALLAMMAVRPLVDIVAGLRARRLRRQLQDVPPHQVRAESVVAYAVAGAASEPRPARDTWSTVAASWATLGWQPSESVHRASHVAPGHRATLRSSPGATVR